MPPTHILIQTGYWAIQFLVNFEAIKVEKLDLWIPRIIVVKKFEIRQTNNWVICELIHNNTSNFLANGVFEVWRLIVMKLNEIGVKLMPIIADSQRFQPLQAKRK